MFTRFTGFVYTVFGDTVVVDDTTFLFLNCIICFNICDFLYCFYVVFVFILILIFITKMRKLISFFIFFMDGINLHPVLNMMTPYDYEFEFSDCESEHSFGNSSFEVPEISNRIEEEHKLVCMIVNNLQSQLASALKRRDEIRKEIVDREFIDHSCQCAQYWIHATHEHVSIVKGNLRGLMNNLNKCNCCERHQTKRPSVENGDNGVYESSGRSIRDKDGDLSKCDCKCRSTCRAIARTMSTLETRPRQIYELIDPTSLEAEFERALECV